MNAFAQTSQMYNRNEQPLTLDALKGYAPSAFATEAHDSRSDRYAYIPTSEIITALMKEGFEPFKAMQSRSRIEGKSEFTKHLIRFRHPDSSNAVAVVGECVPEIVLINSHDGTSAYKLCAGVYRFVCSNGLMVSDSTIASLSIMHKGNIVDNVLEASFEIVEKSSKAMLKVQEWGGIALNAPEQKLFATYAHAIRFADSEGYIDTPITPDQLLIPRRIEDASSNSSRLPKPDLWHTLNVTEENVIKGGLSARQHGNDPETGRRRHRLITTREVKGIDADKRCNTLLWDLAEKMAEIKKAQG